MRIRSPDTGQFQKAWTPEHDDMLRELYPATGNKHLVRRMGFALQTIMGRASVLGIHKIAGGTDRAFPVGHISTDSSGYKIIKLAELTAGKTPWIRLHVFLWLEKYGPIPPRNCIIFADGDKENCCIENLVLKTYAERLRDNKP